MAFLFDSMLDDRPVAFAPPVWVPAAAAASLSLTALIAIYVYLGVWLGSVSAVAMCSAFMIWLWIGYRHPVTRRALPNHILLVIAMLVFWAELTASDFANVITQSFPDLVQPANVITESSLAISLGLGGTFVWLLGGGMAFYHVRAGGYFMVLLSVWSIVLPLSNIALWVYTPEVSGEYPGIFSGFLVTCTGIISLRFKFRNKLGELPK